MAASGVPEMLAELLGHGLVDRADVARALGTTPRTVARWQAGAVAPRRRALERLLELRAVVAVVAGAERGAGAGDTHGVPTAAALWLRCPHPALGFAKPLEAIAEGGYRDVIAAFSSPAHDGGRPAAPA